MKSSIIDSITACMPASFEMAKIQRIQTGHRMKLAEFWGVKQGERILEIGCGQGDTTAVLAYFTGEQGLVHGIDIGSESYGSPITLGDSAVYIKQSALGKQVKMEFGVDILASNVDFPENSFDCIVLAHCSWYMKSFEELRRVLQRVRKWGKRLCFAEWDARINSTSQYSHFLAVLIQAQYESFKQKSDANIRTLFTARDCRKIAEEAGWSVINEKTINSPKLQDGKWEVDYVLTNVDKELDQIENMPEKLERLIRTEVSMLEGEIKVNEIKPLSVYTFVGK